jgi:hypothetical protein
MKKLVAAALLCVSGVLLGAVSARPAGQGALSAAPPVRTQAAQVQTAKLQDPQITELKQQVAALMEQDRQMTAQLGQLKFQVGQLQAQIAEVKAHGYDYVPKAGPGNCTSSGYMNLASLPKSATTLVYTWDSCKTQ